MSCASRLVVVVILAGCTGTLGTGTVAGDGGACTGSCDGGPTTVAGAITVSPATAMLSVNTTPVMQAFTAKDSAGHDVTAQATWTVSDGTVGSMTGGTFTSTAPLPHGGTFTVTAMAGGRSATATLVLLADAPPVVDGSAPATAPSAFGGPAGGDTQLALVYPFDGTLLPRNHVGLTAQWTSSGKETIYDLHVAADTYERHFYVGSPACNGGRQCVYTFKDADWQAIAASATGAAVKISVAGVVVAGGAVATSPAIKVSVSPDDVKGGLYYFSPSRQGLMRLPFGATKAVPFSPAGGTCVGCHAVSHDGKRVSATFGRGDGTGGMLDGASGAVLTGFSAPHYNFATFSPDGTKLLTNWAGTLELHDASTGALLTTVPQQDLGAKEAVMPEWSPDGQSIVFVGIPAEGGIGKDMSSSLQAGDWIVGNGGSIEVMPYSGGSFGPARVVVASQAMQQYNFYPSWSPDSQWIVFATGTWPGNSPTAAENSVDQTGRCISYDQDTARLRMVAAAGGAPIELVAATHMMNKTSSWPKFTPFVQAGGKLVFITFSAKFPYGFLVNPPGSAPHPQIWMSAIDLSKAQAGGGDPSYPPFWLPFQDPLDSNHSTIWTTDVACMTNNDCPTGFSCMSGACVPGVS